MTTGNSTVDVCVSAAGAQQGKPANQPVTTAATTSRDKAATEHRVEEMIQPKKTPAPTKAGKCRR